MGAAVEQPEKQRAFNDFKIYFIFICMCVLPHVCIYSVCLAPEEVIRKCLDSLDLELLVVVNYRVWGNSVLDLLVCYHVGVEN